LATVSMFVVVPYVLDFERFCLSNRESSGSDSRAVHAGPERLMNALKPPKVRGFLVFDVPSK